MRQMTCNCLYHSEKLLATVITMGKKKRVDAAAVRAKRKTKEKKVNPFNLHINNVKHQVLGKNREKFEHGVRGKAKEKVSLV